MVAGCDEIDWLKVSASAAPKFEFAPEVLHNTPLFNTPPIDDKSLDSFRQDNTTPSSPVATTQAHIPTLHLITPVRPADPNPHSSAETVAEDLTEDGGYSLVSMASRLSVLENNIGLIAKSLNTLAQAHQSNPPASHEGAGAAT